MQGTNQDECVLFSCLFLRLPNIHLWMAVCSISDETEERYEREKNKPTNGIQTQERVYKTGVQSQKSQTDTENGS